MIKLQLDSFCPFRQFRPSAADLKRPPPLGFWRYLDTGRSCHAGRGNRAMPGRLVQPKPTSPSDACAHTHNSS